MTKINQINDRSAAVAWSPMQSHPDVIALGAKDSGGTGFEDTGGELELYDMNLSRTGGGDAMLLGAVKTKSRFSSLGWTSGTVGGKYTTGLLAGGMEDGSVHVWNPTSLMSKTEDSVVASYSQHAAGPVKALQFNSLNPTQMATGGSDGKVLISNLEKPENVFTPCETSQQRAQITSLSWNTQVAHIVASSAADGTVAVWDLNGRKAWCELRGETAGQAVADVAWNPSQGLHLLTASADDRNPVLKLWDLRASTSMPLATLAGHTQGILSMAWCPHDEHLLLSCGKDNRTILWDLHTLRPIADVPTDTADQQPEASGSGQDMFATSGLASSQQRRYDVQWSPIKRGVASTCSLDRKVQAHSILGLSSKSGRPPKWMRPSSGVSCGFGGSIVSCGSTDKIVRIRTVVEQPELEKLSSEFEAKLASTDVTSFCSDRASKATDSGEIQLWSFMQVIFETNARQQLLDMLGFDPAEIATKAAEHNEDSAINGVEGMSLEDKQSTGMSKATEEIVKRALMVGNFEAAVDCCFRNGNLADALVLASCGGADLWTKTQERYFESQSPKRPFLSVVNAIIRSELEELVKKSDPAKWAETLAILSTYGKSEEFPQLCVTLGDLLEAAGDARCASLCYMCSLNLELSAKYWRIQLEAANEAKGSLDLTALHEFVVKVSVFMKAIGPSATLSEEDSKLFSLYAEKLAEQGLLTTAAKYCLGDSSESKLLRDRLYRSKASQTCLAAMGGTPPEFPFSLADVKKSRVQPKAQQVAQQPSATSYNQQQGYTQQTTSAASSVPAQTVSQTASPAALPSGWSEHQDPTSGRIYYFNQSTGETTWERPASAPAPTPAPAPAPQAAPQQQQQPAASAASAASAGATSTTPSRTANLASKYGDGFVTSASHPELADQYGNVGTSNPYSNTKRPGTAKVASIPEKAPVSGTMDMEKINELKEEHYPIRDCLLGLIDALKNVQLSSVDKRLLAESEKATAVLLKRLARGDISDDIGAKVLTMTQFISSYDFRSAQSVQTGLVNSDWKEHKDWLKGIKAVLQLATKTWGGK